ncbi:hypothetical protein AVEN_6198-1 [Araneus ventricosus]|uniref:Uncharacterized protein n=1 Tax=Araneus ventricosus TaxID=182803 RepID=A0A4Y2J2J8_ARAVE|nr:hypothetical protein AVEN_6198-1 [Araneus ventricosus]
MTFFRNSVVNKNKGLVKRLGNTDSYPFSETYHHTDVTRPEQKHKRRKGKKRKHFSNVNGFVYWPSNQGNSHLQKTLSPRELSLRRTICKKGNGELRPSEKDRSLGITCENDTVTERDLLAGQKRRPRRFSVGRPTKPPPRLSWMW